MTTLTCRRCGDEFDPDREPPVEGADTSRCPGCGATNDLEADGGHGETAVVLSDVDEIEVTVTIEFRRD